MNLQFQPNEFGAGIGPDSNEQANLFASLHRALRGRYVWAILLASVLGMLGGFAGYRLKEPVYTASGLIQVYQRITKVLYGVQENDLLQNQFDDVVAAEARKVGSQRVIELAAQDPELLSAGWPTGTVGITRLRNELEVRHSRRETIIEVAVTDENPRLAMFGANAILNAYEQIYGNASVQTVTEREKILRSEKSTLDTQLMSSRNQMKVLAERYGTTDLEKLHEAKLDQLVEITQKLTEVQLKILSIRAPEAGSDAVATDDQPEADETKAVTPELLATVDKELANLLFERNRLNALLESSLQAYGKSHPEIRSLERQILQTQTQVDQRVKDLQLDIDEGRLSLVEPESSLSNVESLETLKAIEDDYKSRKEEISSELSELSSTIQDVQQAREEQQRFKSRINDIDEELASINMERAGFLERGRIAISDAGQPTQYSSDKRKQFAVLGGGGGVMLGVGMVWLFGILRPSYRYIDELEQSAPLPILGTLPDLTNPEQEHLAMASLSIHHLRNMLSLRGQRHPDRHPVFMVTSARQGDGKTSLVLALGMSFASEGMRTVMIDADLVGRGLSRSLDLDDQIGLTDVLGKSTIDGAIHSTQVKGLWMVPVGQPGGHRPEELASQQIRRTIDMLRQEFDVILIDTGPLMGSLEANVIASIADETVLTISRGQDPRVVRAALSRLEQIGGHCAGLVFNRAAQHDLERSVSQVSFHSQSIRLDSVRQTKSNRGAVDPGNQQGSERKALVRAIMDSTPESNEDSTIADWKNESA